MYMRVSSSGIDAVVILLWYGLFGTVLRGGGEERRADEKCISRLFVGLL
jgi:hypothetical protein